MAVARTTTAIVRVDQAPLPFRASAGAPARRTAGRPLLADTRTATRLLRCLDAATSEPTVATVAALRAALTDLVDRMKALDVPLERVLATVDTLVCDHGAAGRVLPIHATGPSVRTVRDDSARARVLDWCARAYRDDEWW